MRSRFDSNEFRSALGAFATGVTVVTTNVKTNNATTNNAKTGAGENLVGITVNSFASVSLDPPLVLWSMDKGADVFEVFNQASHYAVHILRHDQEQLSQHFATNLDNKFTGLEYELGIEKLPLLTQYCARFQCQVTKRYNGGDHIILVARVLEMDHRPAQPLVFHAGDYKKLGK